jgi:hypothetical protein
MGAARFDPEYPVSVDKLLSKADALMYAQKRRAKEKLQRDRKQFSSDFQLRHKWSNVNRYPYETGYESGNRKKGV